MDFASTFLAKSGLKSAISCALSSSQSASTSSGQQPKQNNSSQLCEYNDLANAPQPSSLISWLNFLGDGPLNMNPRFNFSSPLATPRREEDENKPQVSERSVSFVKEVSHNIAIGVLDGNAESVCHLPLMISDEVEFVSLEGCKANTLCCCAAKLSDIEDQSQKKGQTESFFKPTVLQLDSSFATPLELDSTALCEASLDANTSMPHNEKRLTRAAQIKARRRITKFQQNTGLTQGGSMSILRSKKVAIKATSSSKISISSRISKKTDSRSDHCLSVADKNAERLTSTTVQCMVAGSGSIKCSNRREERQVCLPMKVAHGILGDIKSSISLGSLLSGSKAWKKEQIKSYMFKAPSTKAEKFRSLKYNFRRCENKSEFDDKKQNLPDCVVTQTRRTGVKQDNKCYICSIQQNKLLSRLNELVCCLDVLVEACHEQFNKQKNLEKYRSYNQDCDIANKMCLKVPINNSYTRSLRCAINLTGEKTVEDVNDLTKSELRQRTISQRHSEYYVETDGQSPNMYECQKENKVMDVTIENSTIKNLEAQVSTLKTELMISQEQCSSLADILSSLSSVLNPDFQTNQKKSRILAELKIDSQANGNNDNLFYQKEQHKDKIESNCCGSVNILTKNVIQQENISLNKSCNCNENSIDNNHYNLLSKSYNLDKLMSHFNMDDKLVNSLDNFDNTRLIKKCIILKNKDLIQEKNNNKISLQEDHNIIMADSTMTTTTNNNYNNNYIKNNDKLQKEHEIIIIGQNLSSENDIKNIWLLDFRIKQWRAEQEYRNKQAIEFLMSHDIKTSLLLSSSSSPIKNGYNISSSFYSPDLLKVSSLSNHTILFGLDCTPKHLLYRLKGLSTFAKKTILSCIPPVSQQLADDIPCWARILDFSLLKDIKKSSSSSSICPFSCPSFSSSSLLSSSSSSYSIVDPSIEELLSGIGLLSRKQLGIRPTTDVLRNCIEYMALSLLAGEKGIVVFCGHIGFLNFKQLLLNTKNVSRVMPNLKNNSYNNKNMCWDIFEFGEYLNKEGSKSSNKRENIREETNEEEDMFNEMILLASDFLETEKINSSDEKDGSFRIIIQGISIQKLLDLSDLMHEGSELEIILDAGGTGTNIFKMNHAKKNSKEYISEAQYHDFRSTPTSTVTQRCTKNGGLVTIRFCRPPKLQTGHPRFVSGQRVVDLTTAICSTSNLCSSLEIIIRV